MGRVEQFRRLLPAASNEDRHRALAAAAQFGHVDIVRLLLDAGEDPSRYNPGGFHSHSTPLHQAALAGHEEVVRLLVERGARLDIRDVLWNGTPADWAHHNGHTELGDYLRTLKNEAGNSSS
jgi:ankyrin repeat protein